MKIISKKFFTGIAFIFGVINAIAGNPPVPNPAGRKKPPPPPGLAIDDSILLLLLAGVLLGIYYIYITKSNIKKSNL
jgi:hypothetical protein